MSVDDWHAALIQTIDEYVDRDYAWGTVDCCQFAARYWCLLTGIDHAAAFTYRSEHDALRLLHAFGKRQGLLQLVVHCLGPSLSGEPEAGDLVVSKQAAALLVGVFNGGYVVGVDKQRGCCRWLLNECLGRWNAAGCCR